MRLELLTLILKQDAGGGWAAVQSHRHYFLKIRAIRCPNTSLSQD